MKWKEQTACKVNEKPEKDQFTWHQSRPSPADTHTHTLPLKLDCFQADEHKNTNMSIGCIWKEKSTLVPSLSLSTHCQFHPLTGRSSALQLHSVSQSQGQTLQICSPPVSVAQRCSSAHKLTNTHTHTHTLPSPSFSPLSISLWSSAEFTCPSCSQGSPERACQTESASKRTSLSWVWRRGGELRTQSAPVFP